MSDKGLEVEELVDADIRVTGVASTAVDIDGKLTDLTILAPDPAAVQIERRAHEPASLAVQSLAKVMATKGQTWEHRLRFQGRIEKMGENGGVQFRDSSGRVAISSVAGLDTRQTGAVDIVAFVDRKNSGWSLADARLTLKTPPLAKSGNSPAAITSIAELHALDPERAALGIPVLIDGVVTYFDRDWQMMFLEGATGGVYISLHGSRDPPSLRVGDRVRIQGLSEAGDFAPVVVSPQIYFLSHASLPSPSLVNAETIFSGVDDSQWVELEGVVESIGFDGSHPSAKLLWGSHTYKLTFPPSVKLSRQWIDARVKVQGAAGTLFNAKRQVLGIQLFVQGLDQLRRLPDLRISRDGGEPPVLAIDKLLQFNPNEVAGHRVHLRGKVLATQPGGPTWIRDDSGAVVIREHNEIVLNDGDIVDVLGFASPGAFAPEIHEGVLSKRSSGAAEKPINVTPQRALFQGMHGQLVRIEGRLVGQYRNGQEQTLLLRNGKSTFVVRAMGNLPAYEIGAVLRSTGICSVSAKRYRGVMVPSSLEIEVESPASVSLVRSAPWLNEKRAWRVLALTSLLIAAALTWVIMLRRRVIGQTRIIAQKLVEVERLKEKAEAASDAKSQFLANMSHELRTPMNGILGMAELAMRAESLAEERECLATIRSSGDALLVILNDLLDLSKIEAGKFQIEHSAFSIRELVREAGRVFAFSMKEKGLLFESSVADSIPDALLGDPMRLRQILLNLLGNAVKFTQVGSVSLTAAGEPEGDQVVLRLVVRDSGIGIPLERQKRIFEPFRQADDSIARHYGGTGLGLSICLKLVNLMSGALAVDSEPGRGSAFSIQVPLKLAPPREAAALAPSGGQTASIVARLKILLAEDNLVNQTVAARLLRKEGHDVVVAGNGKLAVEEFERGTFDLILMDVQMPEMSGLDATREIRLLERSRKTRVPIIALTAQTMEGDRENCLRAGMDGFASKPIRLPELWAAISALTAPAIQ
jgi:signal transduction histidine kinase/CheY-like chemotaxis protein